MNMNKTIAAIVIISILLSLPAIADTNNDSKVEEIITITVSRGRIPKANLHHSPCKMLSES
ncbi:MAG: hypothetical protein U9N36_07130 [Euryarchaeota archaeon]|nr:hypothetical protein [Euryarchaeota archaeon]